MPKTPASPKKIIPPEGWKDGDGFGLLYGPDAQGQSVDLVRLSDLVGWIQSERRISRKEALQVVIDAMPKDAMGWIYRLQPGDAAKLVGPNEAFGQPTRESVSKAAAKTKQDQLKAARELIKRGQW